MKTFAAIAAAAMFFAMAAQSAEPTFNFEAVSETADSVVGFYGRCVTYRNQMACSF